MPTEEKLELIYIFCLENNCPLEIGITRSLSKLAVKGLSVIPTRFQQLDSACKELYNYVRERNKTITYGDIDTYLAWRIWHHKLTDITRLIEHKLAQKKAYLVNAKTIKELHKVTSRMGRVVNDLQGFLTHCKDDYELLNEVKNLLQIAESQYATTQAFVNELLSIQKSAINGVNEIFTIEVKQFQEGK